MFFLNSFSCSDKGKTSGNILSVNYRYLDITEYWFASLLRVGVDGMCLFL